MNRIVFVNTEKDLKDMELTIEDIKQFTKKIDCDVIITDKCLITDGREERLQ